LRAPEPLDFDELLPEERLLPAEEREPPPDDRLLPAEERELPPDERLLPVDERGLPPEERLLPADERELLPVDLVPPTERVRGALDLPGLLPTELRDPLVGLRRVDDPDGDRAAGRP